MSVPDGDCSLTGNRFYLLSDITEKKGSGGTRARSNNKKKRTDNKEKLSLGTIAAFPALPIVLPSHIFLLHTSEPAGDTLSLLYGAGHEG